VGDPTSQYALARLSASGHLDPTFPNGGVAGANFFAGSSEAKALRIQDGKVVAAGFHYNSGSRMILVTRHLGNGSLDTTFNNAGLLLTNITCSSDEQANALAVRLMRGESEPRIFAAGSAMACN
jgi:hypothetical protein